MASIPTPFPVLFPSLSNSTFAPTSGCQISLSGVDDDSSGNQNSGLVSVVYVNLFVFALLVTIFELSRHYKLIYLCRIHDKDLIKSNRVAPQPSQYWFGWISSIYSISEEEFLRLAGLDAYMFLRYINVCLRFSGFVMVWGLICLVPLYHNSSVNHSNTYQVWNLYTMANIDLAHPDALWAPTIFAYIFSLLFCYLMRSEYEHFVEKRVDYLVNGDPDTSRQTDYTLMLERIPSEYRSAPKLRDFFEKMFPDDVFCVQFALDLKELNKLSSLRTTVRNKLEKDIAFMKATGARPTISVPSKDDPYLSVLPHPVHQSYLAEVRGRVVVDSIEYHALVLKTLNIRVRETQKRFYSQMQGQDHVEEVRGVLETKAKQVIGKIKDAVAFRPFSTEESCPLEEDLLESQQSGRTEPTTETNPLKQGVTRIAGATSAVVGTATLEGLKTAQIATKGTMGAVLTATRALEMLTIGTVYDISATAFVTLKSRVAKNSAQQMLLSQKHFQMKVLPAPNPKNIIWDNVSTPKQQIDLRKTISETGLVMGALFWSLVVAFITTLTDFNSLSQEKGFHWLQNYAATDFYKLLNSYLASALLLILLNLLPFIFDWISRNYEGVKTESGIQSSIMNRYFYFQLANVWASVVTGTIFTKINCIISNPFDILNILGNSLPTVSVYFTKLLIVKTFTAVPLEMIRFWPSIGILSVLMCLDEKKCTRREMRSGALSNAPMLYGWIYPNLMMVLMIMLVYMTIAPLLIPICFAFFLFCHMMYKYQLLYVYLTDYQAGGDMWFVVFSRSMVCLLAGVVTLICYLAILISQVEDTFSAKGPFYTLLPLPFLICYFWGKTEKQFKPPCLNLSLENAVDDDHRPDREEVLRRFKKDMFVQPALSEGEILPAAYRRTTPSKSRGSFVAEVVVVDEEKMSTTSPNSSNSSLPSRPSALQLPLMMKKTSSRITDNDYESDEEDDEIEDTELWDFALPNETTV